MLRLRFAVTLPGILLTGACLATAADLAPGTPAAPAVARASRASDARG